MSIHKDTVYNVVGNLLPQVLTLVIIPRYIALVGDTRYGVLAIALLLLGYFGVFDLGLSRATAQRIAELSNDSPAKRAESFWTALYMNGAFGIFGGLIIWPVAHYFLVAGINAEPALRPELIAAIPWLIVAVPLATITGVLNGTLLGRARFIELNILSVFSSVIIQLAPLAVAWIYGPNLAWLLAAVVLSRLVTLMALLWRCYVHVIRGQPRVASLEQAKSLLRFGGWVTVSSLVAPLMMILDRFVIGVTLGAKAVTYYTVPFQLTSRSTIILDALSSALFPRLAAADLAEGKRMADAAIRLMAVIMTPVILFGVLIMGPFLSWWLGPEFAAQAVLPGQILLLGFWIGAFAGIPFMQLQAIGRPDLVAKCHLVEILPYLVLLIGGLHFFGLPGAAFAFGLRALADCFLLMYFTKTASSGMVALAVPSVFLLSGLAAATSFSAGGGPWWVIASILMLLSMFWTWHIAAADIRRFVSSFSR